MSQLLPPATEPDTTPAPSEGWQPRFWSIWLGQALSLTGSALSQFVLIWWITITTGSTSALAVAGVMALLPQALLGPLGGVLADRFSRRLIMIVADTVAALAMLVVVALFASQQVQLWHLYGLMALRSSMQALQSPAMIASTAMLVPASMLTRVAGLNQLLAGVMTIAAAPLGAVLLAVLPFAGALLVDVVTALLGIIPLLIWAIPQPVRAARAGWGFWADFQIGLRVVTGHRGLLLLYGLITLVVLTIMPTFTLTPLLVQQHFGGGVNEVALMEGLAGLGIIGGGLLIAVLPIGQRQVATILISWALSCAAVAGAALMPGTMLWAAAVWWCLSGVTFSTGNAPLLALLQTRVPNQVQGRVLSLLNTLVGLAGPLGLLLAAPLGELVGVRGLFIIGGTLSAIVCLFGFAAPSLMRLETTPITADE